MSINCLNTQKKKEICFNNLALIRVFAEFRSGRYWKSLVFQFQPIKNWYFFSNICPISVGISLLYSDRPINYVICYDWNIFPTAPIIENIFHKTADDISNALNNEFTFHSQVTKLFCALLTLRPMLYILSTNMFPFQPNQPKKHRFCFRYDVCFN